MPKKADMRNLQLTDKERERKMEQLYIDYSYGIIEDYSELVEKIKQLNRVRNK